MFKNFLTKFLIQNRQIDTPKRSQPNHQHFVELIGFRQYFGFFRYRIFFQGINIQFVIGDIPTSFIPTIKRMCGRSDAQVFMGFPVGGIVTGMGQDLKERKTYLA